MRGRRLSLAALALLLWTGCENQTAAPFQEGILLFDSQSALDRGMAATRFDFGTLRELFVRVRGAQLPQVAMVNIKLISPRGVVHYETNAWFSTDPAVKSMDMGAGAPAATVHLARKIPGGFALDLPIPVSGTVLARYPKTGTWQVAAAIDGIPRTFSSPMDVYISGN